MSIHSFAAPTSVPHAPIYCLLKSQAQRAPKAVAIFVYEMPGEHLDVIHGPLVKAWAERLRTCLQNAQTQSPSNLKPAGRAQDCKA